MVIIYGISIRNRALAKSLVAIMNKMLKPLIRRRAHQMRLRKYHSHSLADSEEVWCVCKWRYRNAIACSRH